MAKRDRTIEFKESFATHKKGSKATLSRDLCNMLIKRGVAKEYVKPKRKTKDK